MKIKRRISLTMRVLIVITIVFVLVIGMIIIYHQISNTINDINYANTADIENNLAVIKGLLLLMIFLNVSVFALLGKTLYDVYSESKVNAYANEVSRMISIIDQQTTVEKLDFWNDKLIKIVGSYARLIPNVKYIYQGLNQIYKIKSMKTENDFEKIKMYTNILMKAYAETYSIREVYTDKKIHNISEAAVMYDIGKLGTPGHILYREAALSKEDYELAKQHSEVGYRLLSVIKPKIKSGSFEQYARDIAGFHHERYDGSGYPYGKQGEDIPFIARVIAVITTYKTITNDRPYRKAMSHDEAVLLINNEKNRYFDPKIVKIFNAVEKEFEKIKNMNLD